MELLIPAMLVVLGLGLVVDSLRKPQKPMFSFSYNKDGKEVGTEEFSTGSNSFEFKASFTQADRTVSLSQLQRGSIHTSFGDYTVDLSGVKSVGPNCFLEIHNSFGNLDLLVPRRYQVVSENSAGFASIEIDSNPHGSDGIIHLETHCRFGQVDVTYI
jgi:predicted membrane protein